MAILDDLDRILEARKTAASDDSYVASLYAAGINKILEKIGEEATEVVLAAKDAASGKDRSSADALASEVADLWFHTLVALHHLDLSSADVLDVLERRFGLSGIEEKANRNKHT